MMSGESFDQSMIDKIVATAESDTIESKVANLEEEVTEIKGSIKNLLMDIRETMSVLENPFQNIQGIANISGAIVNPRPIDDGDKEETKENESDDTDLELMEQVHKSPFEDMKQSAQKLPKRNDSKLIDPLAFYNTIVWSKDMVEKYDNEAIKELIEVFSLLGYIPGDIKEIILKVIEILVKNNNLDGAVVDLYRLYHILYPEDLSLDSKILGHVLNETDMVKNAWQRKS
ncbi:hypothetical protein EO95_03555 [Methanosarcina sp. 1.H.T.1A.1]|uniref:hypothetical protein n=1 Tax=Methanosarcina sp. 1.H.T.1A.1 TaxID=1483602 RepID=UPI00062191EC|nr:hypothetical protein [Methanosarcina sp. 1.H.T.1A.1]KKH99741.1 hypothetical protein EO95_03555 [Methanosarcina sp. 1.H.T.1A.1]